ncbi:Hypothetical predicted protein [Olea europaea subsp. europaea]|uniref:Uncharacterized protein n=1 Tax=Olea europaea subsp. europaea TaxID=158383 RepID=A0A8S0Q0N9_OLEEU|nr:Hypothetical predicted protein [Olea europaea subsp. europaea]
MQDTFLGEILGAVILAGDRFTLKATFESKPIRVLATGIDSEDGQMIIDQNHGNSVKVLEEIVPFAFFDAFANQLGDEKQSAIVGSFEEQRRIWNTPQR